MKRGNHGPRSSYEVAHVGTTYKTINGKPVPVPTVWIVDRNEEGMKSVTNDAARVCEELNTLYPRHRIIYKDTMGNWDELVHLDGHFNHYATAHRLGLA